MFVQDKSKVPAMRAKVLEKWTKFLKALDSKIEKNGSTHMVGDKVCLGPIGS